MSLKTRILDDSKQALRAGDKARLKVLRMAAAAIKQREIDDRNELNDSQVIAIIEKMIKQRRESADQFRAGARPELAAAEEAETAILDTYLPTPLAEEELEALIEEVVQALGAVDIAAMGQVMAAVKQRAQGRVDLGRVAGRVRARLST